MLVLIWLTESTLYVDKSLPKGAVTFTYALQNFTCSKSSHVK